MSTRKCIPINPEMTPRIEQMIEDECPAHEIARTFGLQGNKITYWYPQAVRPAHERGQYAAMARKFNALPDFYTPLRKTA